MKWIPPFGATDPNEQYVNAAPTIPGSNPPADFFNTILNELLAVIVAADMTPDDTVVAQVSKAIVALAERAATSGVTKGGFWFGKTTANFVVPNPTLVEQNYIDFTTLNTYTAKADLSGWDFAGAFVPPTGIDYTILITSKFWDIPEQDGQQGGWAQYDHTDDEWTWWPRIVSFVNVALSGVSTAPTPSPASPNNQIANKEYVDTAITYASFDLFDNKWRDATTTNPVWKLSDGNWINRADAETAWDHLQYDAGHETTSYPWVQLQSVAPKTFIRAADFDETGADYPYAYANITNGVLTLRYSTSSTGGSGVTGPIYYDGPNAGASGWGAEYGGTMTSATIKIETVAGISVMCWLGEDGHKIVRPAWKPSTEYDTIVSGQDTAVDAIYAATGVAWYYILDGSNQRFKLPRINPVLVETDITTSVPLKGSIGYGAGGTYFVATGSSFTQLTQPSVGGYNVDVSNNQTIPGASADLSNKTTVYSGNKYLYFYVGI